MEELKLEGKHVIHSKIKVLTGLHIGGPTTGLNIGGVDNIVIKDVEGKPYIPGSSLKGKMRSLLEKSEGLAKERVWVVKDEVSIHMCNNSNCIVCSIFGRTSGKHTLVDKKEEEKDILITNVTPTRLIVRDVFLDPTTLEKFREKLDFEWTEVKWENVIDRVTSQATPRQIERVPPNAIFGTDEEPFEMIYNVFNNKDKENLKYVFKAMKLLEQDYLGGSGTRGYGKIKFIELKVFWNSSEAYEKGEINKEGKEYSTVDEILKNFDNIKKEG